MAIVKLEDLKVGDEISVLDTIPEVWVPLYGTEGEAVRLRIENVPIGALV